MWFKASSVPKSSAVPERTCTIGISSKQRSREEEMYLLVTRHLDGVVSQTAIRNLDVVRGSKLRFRESVLDLKAIYC